MTVGPARALRPGVCTALLVAAALGPATALAGSISVTSDVPGQAIVLDGSPTQLTTPARIDGVAPGAHTVLVRGGCQIGTTTVQVPDKGVVEASLLTRPARSKLSLAVEPAGATVTIDGTAAQPGGLLDLSCGAHSIRVAQDGYLQEVRKVELGAGETVDMRIALERLGIGSLVLTVQPETAEVSLDGAFVAKGDYRNTALSAGPHVVEVTAQGHTPQTKMFVLEASQSLDYSIALERIPGAPLAAAGKDPGRSSGGGGHALRNTGIGVAVAGAGVAVVGLTRFAVSGRAYQDYLAASQDPSGSAATAEAIREDEVVPARNLGVTLSSLGTAMLAGGITMAIVF